MLGWATLINFTLLAWWILFLIFAHDWTHQLHTKWFRLSPEQFDAIHYSLMGVFKMGVITSTVIFIPVLSELFEKADSGGMITLEKVDVIHYIHGSGDQ